MCFGSTLSYPYKESLNSRPLLTRPEASLTRTRTQSSAGQPAPAQYSSALLNIL